MPERGLGSRQALVGLALAVVVIVLDQWSKSWATATLEYRVPLTVTSWFDLMLAHNTGAAFSFLADAGGWQRWFFSGVAVLVSGVVVVWLARLRPGRWRLALALGLVLGGGLGNFWDRLVHGYVVDFLSLHYRDLYWPAFNLADSAITLGAVMIILDGLFSEGGPGTDTGRDNATRKEA